MKLRFKNALLSATCLALSACGGGNNGPSLGSQSHPAVLPAVSQPAPSSTATTVPTNELKPATISSVSYALQTGLQRDALPTLRNYSGTLSLNIKTSPSAAASLKVMTTSTNIVAQSKLKLQSGFTRTAIYSVAIQVSESLTLHGFPSFDISSPSFAGLQPGTLSYQVYDDAECIDSIAGSANVTDIVGQDATFAALPNDVSLDPGHVYTFVFFTTLPVADRQAIVYTTEPNNNAVIGIAPGLLNTGQITQTIDGPQTGLNKPLDIAVGPDGIIYVLNQADASFTGTAQMPHQSILEFAPDAQGNAEPIKTFSAINQYGPVNHIAVSQSNTVYVSYPGAQGFTRNHIAGGYFTISQNETLSAPVVASANIQGFGVSPDDRVAEFMFDESSFRDEIILNGKSLSLQGGDSGNYSFAFDPINGALFINSGATAVYDRSGAFLDVFFVKGHSPILGLNGAFDAKGGLYYFTTPPDQPKHKEISVLDNPLVFPPRYSNVPGSTSPDAIYDLDSLLSGAATSGLAIGEQ